MNDENERSVASAGSVADEPVAYGVVYPDGTTGAVGWRWEDCLEVAGVSDVIVALYRHPQPTLTTEEREAVDAAQNHIDGYDGEWGDEIAATLRGLLERLK